MDLIQAPQNFFYSAFLTAAINSQFVLLHKMENISPAPHVYSHISTVRLVFLCSFLCCIVLCCTVLCTTFPFWFYETSSVTAQVQFQCQVYIYSSQVQSKCLEIFLLCPFYFKWVGRWPMCVNLHFALTVIFITNCVDKFSFDILCKKWTVQISNILLIVSKECLLEYLTFLQWPARWVISA